MPREPQSARVGLTILAAVVLLAIAVLMVGEQNFLFTPRHSYFIRFPSVAGLAEDNPVQLNGVTVGKVDRIVLPEDASDDLLTVWIGIQKRYANRLRKDSLARIKSFGLLGDKYVEVTSGHENAVIINPGEEVPAAPPTDVDKLIASGENVAENVVSTAHSLARILERMDAGEGVIGDLVTERDGPPLSETVADTLASIQRLVHRIESGEGVVGRLLYDDALATRVESAVVQLDELVTEVRNSQGLLHTLLHDQELATKLEATVDDASATIAELKSIVHEIESGDGLLPKLLNDEELSQTLTTDITTLLERLTSIAEKLDEGDGSVARLLNDQELYDALNDIVVGVNESKVLRWLLRNRQKAGIEKRADELRDAGSP